MKRRYAHHRGGASGGVQRRFDRNSDLTLTQFSCTTPKAHNNALPVNFRFLTFYGLIVTIDSRRVNTFPLSLPSMDNGDWHQYTGRQRLALSYHQVEQENPLHQEHNREWMA